MFNGKKISEQNCSGNKIDNFNRNNVYGNSAWIDFELALYLCMYSVYVYLLSVYVYYTWQWKLN